MSFLDSPSPEFLSGLKTPCYVFDPHVVIENYQRLRARLRTALIVSFKANSNPELFCRYAHAGLDGVEIASLGELEMILARGKVAKFVNNPSMDAAFLRAALQSRATVILDSLAQVHQLVATPRPADSSVFLRMNASEIVRLSGLAGVARRDHFGFDLESAVKAGQLLKEHNLRVKGLHTFGGSLSWRTNRFAIPAGMKKVIDHFEEVLGYNLESVNLGGGFSGGESDSDFEEYAEQTKALRERYQVLHESGRAIFSSAGAFVTRAVATKSIGDRNYVVCDGGMSQSFLLSQTEAVLKKYQEPLFVPNSEAAPIRETTYLLAGSTCNHQDVIGELRSQTKEIRPGDTFVFRNCGAYHATYTVSPFLSLKPAVVYVLP